MKPYALLTLLMVMSTIAPAAKADQIKVGNTDRTYYTYIPDGLGNDRPLLISMHGMNQDAGYQRGMLQIESVADTAKFAVVFPEGTNRSWDISGTRDINFVLAIIDDMAERYDIDKNRVYLSGFSMGGMFTYHAINHIADRIAAFAPISGYPMGGQAFTSSRPVPIMHTHGTSDDVVNFSGAQPILDGWIARNGCAPEDLVTKPYRGPHATLHQWGPGEDGVEVRLLELADKGHWVANDYFKTGEEIWNFCSRYSLADKHPKVSFTRPTAGADMIAIGTTNGISLNIEATASSEYADIECVDFYADNQYIGSSYEAPYRCVWTDCERGSHMLKVVAKDAEGNSVARAIPFTTKVTKKSQTLSSKFNTDGIIPTGWLVYNGRNLRVGPITGLTGGARVMKMTGAQHAFDYGLYFHHITKDEDKGYAAYGDPRSTALLYLSAGTYAVDYSACAFKMMEGATVRCWVIDINTDEVLASDELPLTVDLCNSAATAFASADTQTLTFSTDCDRTCMIKFLTINEKNSDAVISEVKIRKTGEAGIHDFETSDATVASVSYYDMMGRPATKATKGIVIRRTVYTDGSITTDKTVMHQ